MPLDRRVSPRTRTLVLGTVLATLASVAPLSAAAAQTVKVVAHSALRVLDPHRTTAYITRNHGYMIFDTLLATDATGAIRPQMADWTVSDDKLTYTFKLRDGLKWHDGTPVRAEDCIASLRRWAAIDSIGQMLMDATASLEAGDERTIILKLKSPVGFVIEAIGKPSSYVPFMMPKRTAETPVSQPIKEMIGSGPFRFVQGEFKPGLRVVYDKNKDYVPRNEPPSSLAGGKHVKVGRIEWITMPDPQTSVSALLAGEVDYVESVPVDLLPLIESTKSITIDPLDLGYQIIGRFNHLHPPFNDVRIRRAAMMALSQKDVMEALIGNPKYYKLCGAMFGCGTPLETAEGAGTLLTGGNIEQARKMLKEAGYDGTPVVILHPSDLVLLRAPGIVAANALKQAGFNVDLQSMDWQTVVGRYASAEPPSKGGWNALVTLLGVPDMMSPILNNQLSGKGRKGAPSGWPDDPKIEEMRAAYAKAMDPAEQKQIATSIQRHAYEQVMYVPLGQFLRLTAWNDTIKGIVQAPVTLFWNIEKTK
jgi:peptide/nickel transport system substrate-binding protein